MPEFLELQPPDKALKYFLDSLAGWTSEDEWIDTFTACGRVISQAVYSPERMPSFNRSTVDGFAVIARDTFGASESLPAYLTVAGEVPMGKPTFINLGPGQAAIIHTGGMLPQNSNAVVMMENTQAASIDQVEILKAVAPGENVLSIGEDIKVGDEIIPAGKRLGPADIGGLTAVGILKIKAAVPPKVGIISSGDEVVLPSSSPIPGQVRDINTYSLAAMVQRAGGCYTSYGIVPDSGEKLAAVMRLAMEECDIVVVTAGSSASARDLTADVINEMGKPGVIIHGVNVRPGKPTILAVCNGKPLIGLPGNPVSALVIARLFLIPLIDFYLGVLEEKWNSYILASLSTNVPSQAGRDDWIPVLLRENNGLIAEPIFFKSNFIFNLAKADGIIRIPPDANGLSAGTMVEVYPI